MYNYFPAICGLGQAPNISNTSECIACEIGFYSDVEAADQCTPCGAGLSTVNTMSESDLECIGKNHYPEYLLTRCFIAEMNSITFIITWK